MLNFPINHRQQTFKHLTNPIGMNHKKTQRNCLAALLGLAMISEPQVSADGIAFGKPEGATRTDGDLVAGLALNFFAAI
jgi:hypothetical protein